MKCPSCGYEDEARFCKQCGAPMVTDQKAEYIGAPKYTGITIPPPTASEGFKAEDIDELGLHDDEPGMGGPGGLGGGGGSESVSNSFGMLLIVVLIVAIAIFALKMLNH